MTFADLDATCRFGERLGQLLKPGDFVGLSGDLGAGKTTLARAIVAGAGIDPNDVSSPTFAIINVYEGRLSIAHADLYRVESRAELFATGYFDLLDGDGAMLVEWVERVAGAAPRDWLELCLTIAEDGTRVLSMTPRGGRSEAIAGAFKDSV